MPGLVRCSSSTTRRRRRSRVDGVHLRGRHLRQPEVQNLGVPALGHENIRRLDVAMNDPLGVRRIQRVCNFDRRSPAAAPVPSAVRRCGASASTPSRNSIAMNGLPVVLADFVNRADIRMVQRRRRPRLALESLSACGSCATSRAEISAPQAAAVRVLSLVHHAHPAAAKFLDDAVVRDGLADQFCRIRHWPKY